MNTKDYTYLLNKPYSITERQTMELEAILYEFPFLQSARALHLKGLYNQDSFRYNLELKKTAAYTTDRSILFDFITSEQFQSIQKKFFEEKEKSIEEIKVKDTETIVPAPIAPQPVQNKLEESIKQTIKEAEVHQPKATPIKEAISEEETTQTAEEPQETAQWQSTNDTEEKLEIGKPLDFDKTEKHSFQEWLQLSKLSPVNRQDSSTEKTGEKTDEPEIEEEENSLSKKLELIDRFIESSPKIIPNKGTTPVHANIYRTSQDISLLMTETLARVYLEQKKYQKAIQAYEILILKYPEKSVFFADRISDIKILQQNNNTNNNG